MQTGARLQHGNPPKHIQRGPITGDVNSVVPHFAFFFVSALQYDPLRGSNWKTSDTVGVFFPVRPVRQCETDLFSGAIAPSLLF